MSLLDVVRRHSKKGRQQARGAGATPGGLERLQRTAQTGKAAARGTTPAVSGLQAQQAATQVQQAEREQQARQARARGAQATQIRGAEEERDIQREAQQQRFEQARADIAAETDIQAQQRQAQQEMAAEERSAREEMTVDQITNRYANALADMASERNTVEQNIFQDLSQNMQELGRDKTLAQLEQMGHIMALSDQKYLDELKRVGQLQNLADEMQFKREAVDLTMQKDMEILRQQFDMQELINQDEREFKQKMAKMDISLAEELAAQAMKEERYKSILTGAVELGRAGIKYQSQTGSGEVTGLSEDWED